ncbi:MAG: hypothetical protein M1834_001052 [Cirrosporium novae-zelandiae]|nr:MAG: hypothetical protein M1834_001052 [Cirrosporium novae-zelandiae]
MASKDNFTKLLPTLAAPNDFKAQVASIVSRAQALEPNLENNQPAWYCIVANALASSNAGPAVPHLYSAITAGQPAEKRREILRRILEGLMKGLMLYGVPRTLNAFYPLAADILKDEELLALSPEPVLNVRKDVKNPLDLTERGMQYFRNIYRNVTDRVLLPMERIAPDLMQGAVNLEFGLYMSETAVLSAIETSQVTIGSLLPLDAPSQVQWHMRGLIRNGGKEEQVKFALDIARIVCETMEWNLKAGIPDMGVVKEELEGK